MGVCFTDLWASKFLPTMISIIGEEEELKFKKKLIKIKVFLLHKKGLFSLFRLLENLWCSHRLKRCKRPCLLSFDL